LKAISAYLRITPQESRIIIDVRPFLPAGLQTNMCDIAIGLLAQETTWAANAVRGFA